MTPSTSNTAPAFALSGAHPGKLRAAITESVGWEVVTSAGVTIHTFDCPKAAKVWASERMAGVTGLRLHVEEVTRTERRRRITWLRSVK